jgi:hypothetical protein
MSNAYVISEPTKEQLRREGNHVLEDERGERTSGSVAGRESSEKLLGETTEVGRVCVCLGVSLLCSLLLCCSLFR